MLKQMVEQNGGVTLLPALCVDALHVAPSTARIVPCAAPTPAREISLVSRRAYVKQHLVEALVGTVLQWYTLAWTTQPAGASKLRGKRAIAVSDFITVTQTIAFLPLVGYVSPLRAKHNLQNARRCHSF